MEVFTQHLNSIVHWLWLTTVDNLGAGFTASCQASHRIATKPTTCSSYFVHIPNFMKVWGMDSEDVGSRADFCSMQNLHSRHPWRSIAAVKPPMDGFTQHLNPAPK